MTTNHDHLREVVLREIRVGAVRSLHNNEMLLALLDKLAALRKENEGLRVDAERYRWLRDKCDTTTGFLLCQRVESDEWDCTIDSKMDVTSNG